MQQFYLMNLWRRRAGMREVALNATIDVEQEFEKIDRLLGDFVTLMRNRLRVGSFRYGKKGMEISDFASYAKQKLQMYQDTKNAEFLVDVANLVLLESVYGENHFEADSSEEGKEYDS